MFSKLLSTALVTDSTWIILLVMLIILFAPMILRPLRIPHILGMILAGVLIGPFGLNVLERDKSFELFGQVGLYYIMFLAALEMDTRSLFRNVKQYLFFGFATFIIPFTLGFFGSRMLLGYNNAQSLLIAGILSSNTLIAYPIISRYGLSKEKSVSLSVGGSMLSLLLSLIIVAAVSDIWNADKKDSAYILWFAGKVAIFFAASIVFIPRMTRVYLRYYSDSVSQFIFVIVMMILSAAMAEVCGIEGILGAFLSGLIMNRYIPKMSPLMNRIEFVGNALFIPYFLIGVGMLINIRSLFNGIGTLQVALFMVIVGTLGKALAAYIGARGLKLSRNSGNMMFGLTSAHAAGAISILMVGMQMAVGHGKFLMNDEMLDGVVIMILLTCIISSLITERAARTAALNSGNAAVMDTGDDEKILIPLKNEKTAVELINLAAMMRNPKLNRGMIALNVVYDDSHSHENQNKGRDLLERMTKLAAGMDVRLQTQSRLATNVANGIVHAFKEYDASELVAGMHPIEESSTTSFGNTDYSLMSKLNRQIMFARLQQPLNTIRKIHVCIPENSEFEYGFYRWVERLLRIAGNLRCKIVFYGKHEPITMIQNYAVKEHKNISAEYNESNSAERLAKTIEHIAEDHLLVIVCGRKGTLSYNAQSEKLPSMLHNELAKCSVILLYPDQYGPAVDEITLTAPQQQDDKSGLAIFRRFFTRKK